MCRLFDAGTFFVALDTETTSISPSSGRIMEIGAVKFNKDGVIDKYNQLINPDTLIPPFITGLTHITQSMVENQPFMNQVLPKFLDFIGETLLIAHNARFDMNFINAECQKCNYHVTNNKVIDTLQFAREVFPTLEKHKLEYLADYFKLNKGSSHRAFDDAECCRQLFIKCIEEKSKLL